MLDQWRRGRAERRIQAGDGHALRRFRRWQLFGRSLLSLRLPLDDGREREYTIDVRHWGEREDGEIWAHLYVDGVHHARSRTPAAFPVPGGHIEVATSDFGIKRCHYVTTDDAERRLTPDARSAEGRRARLHRRRPTLSRWIGCVSVLLLVIGIGLNLLQVLEPISLIPPVHEVVGTFTSPVRLPLWLNLALGVGAALASVERALRLRYSWLLDGVGN
ncbi:hypothetical protein [Nocardiopsis sp. MG754419]|uniref:hypothetical protein n=1 Tax=Nocardiopsis sp. MG754419 TaxID=2259865 RepID=UPI001BA94ABA|nr:hypothetical protein [Nocardiopsis sp. MG754419]MBR8741205.1 hypothetical protein [Nocardiopsis sp. MG754419]